MFVAYYGSKTFSRNRQRFHRVQAYLGDAADRIMLV